MHVISLEGSYNARSVGADETPWLVRTASLDGLSGADERTLRALGVDLVIDLREPAEHGPRTHGLPIRSAPLYGEAPPAAGTIEGVYAGLVRERGPRIAAAVGAIAEHPGVVAVHCTAGKDRTGLVVALARLVAGDDRGDVVADYAQSGRTVRPARIEIATAQLDALALKGVERAAAERLHLDSPAEVLEGALDLIDALGGPETYLRTHGVTSAQLQLLRERATRPSSEDPGA